MGRISSLHSQVAKGQAQDIDKYRREIGKSTQWLTEHERPQRHSRPLPQSAGSPRLALLAALLLAAEYGVNAHQALREAGVSGGHRTGGRPHKGGGEALAAGNSTALAIPAQPSGESMPVRGPAASVPHAVARGVRPAPRSRQAQAAEPKGTTTKAKKQCEDGPTNEIRTAMEEVPTRRGIGEKVLRQLGFDPDELVPVSDYMPLGVGGAELTTYMSRIDAYINNQESSFPFFYREVPGAIDKLPELNSRFYREFDSHVDKIADSLAKAASDKLAQIGVSANDPASIIKVMYWSAPDWMDLDQVIPWRMPGLAKAYHQEERAFLLQVGRSGEERYFVLSDGLCGLVVEMPSKLSDRTRWLKEHSRLFFGEQAEQNFDADELKKSRRVLHFATTVHMDGLDVAGAVKEVSRSVARSAMLPLKDAAFAETAYETGIHIGRGLLIPFHDTYRALKEGDVVGALVSAGIDAIQFGSGAHGKMVKLVHSVQKVSSGAKKAGKAMKIVEDLAGSLQKFSSGAKKASKATKTSETIADRAVSVSGVVRGEAKQVLAGADDGLTAIRARSGNSGFKAASGHGSDAKVAKAAGNSDAKVVQAGARSSDAKVAKAASNSDAKVAQAGASSSDAKVAQAGAGSSGAKVAQAGAGSSGAHAAQAGRRAGGIKKVPGHGSSSDAHAAQAGRRAGGIKKAPGHGSSSGAHAAQPGQSASGVKSTGAKGAVSSLRKEAGQSSASEVVRTFRAGADDVLSAAAIRDLKEIGDLMKGDRKILQLMLNPKENCEAALEPVISVLKSAGYETRVRGMYFWSNAGIDAPKNHFLVLAKKNGTEYAVDVTAGQFEEFGIHGPLIMTEEAWAKTFHDAAKRTLIKYADFKTPQAAKTAFSPLKAVTPTDRIDGAVVLSRPAWYGIAKTAEAGKQVASQSGRLKKIKGVLSFASRLPYYVSGLPSPARHPKA